MRINVFHHFPPARLTRLFPRPLLAAIWVVLWFALFTSLVYHHLLITRSFRDGLVHPYGAIADLLFVAEAILMVGSLVIANLQVIRCRMCPVVASVFGTIGLMMCFAYLLRLPIPLRNGVDFPFGVRDALLPMAVSGFALVSSTLSYCANGSRPDDWPVI